MSYVASLENVCVVLAQSMPEPRDTRKVTVGPGIR